MKEKESFAKLWEIANKLKQFLHDKKAGTKKIEDEIPGLDLCIVKSHAIGIFLFQELGIYKQCKNQKINPKLAPLFAYQNDILEMIGMDQFNQDTQAFFEKINKQIMSHNYQKNLEVFSIMLDSDFICNFLVILSSLNRIKEDVSTSEQVDEKMKEYNDIQAQIQDTSTSIGKGFGDYQEGALDYLKKLTNAKIDQLEKTNSKLRESVLVSSLPKPNSLPAGPPQKLDSKEQKFQPVMDQKLSKNSQPAPSALKGDPNGQKPIEQMGLNPQMQGYPSQSLMYNDLNVSTIHKVSEYRSILEKDRFCYLEVNPVQEDKRMEYKMWSLSWSDDIVFKYKRTICSFLNAGGGCLFMGMRELKEPPERRGELEVIGVNCTEKDQDEKKMELIQRITQSFSPKMHVDGSIDKVLRIDFIPVCCQNNRDLQYGNRFVIRVIVSPCHPLEVYMFDHSHYVEGQGSIKAIHAFMRSGSMCLAMEAHSVKDLIASRAKTPLKMTRFSDFAKPPAKLKQSLQANGGNLAKNSVNEGFSKKASETLEFLYPKFRSYQEMVDWKNFFVDTSRHLRKGIWINNILKDSTTGKYTLKIDAQNEKGLIEFLDYVFRDNQVFENWKVFEKK